jgi:hypothetical protein
MFNALLWRINSIVIFVPKTGQKATEYFRNSKRELQVQGVLPFEVLHFENALHTSKGYSKQQVNIVCCRRSENTSGPWPGSCVCTPAAHRTRDAPPRDACACSTRVCLRQQCLLSYKSSHWVWIGAHYRTKFGICTRLLLLHYDDLAVMPPNCAHISLGNLRTILFP